MLNLIFMSPGKIAGRLLAHSFPRDKSGSNFY